MDEITLYGFDKIFINVFFWNWSKKCITRHYSANSTFVLCVQLQLQNTMCWSAVLVPCSYLKDIKSEILNISVIISQCYSKYILLWTLHPIFSEKSDGQSWTQKRLRTVSWQIRPPRRGQHSRSCGKIRLVSSSSSEDLDDLSVDWRRKRFLPFCPSWRNIMLGRYITQIEVRSRSS